MKRYTLVLAVLLCLPLAIIACGGGGGGGGTTPATVSVNGTVLDSRNNPVPFATVTINSIAVTTTTGLDGTFQADVEEGDHQVGAVKSGVSILDTAFTAPSGGVSLGDLGPTVPSGYWPWYSDGDDDTYGDAYDVIDQETHPGAGYTVDFTDCNDGDEFVNPAASEYCNGGDDNCNGTVDEGLALVTYYQDSDVDGYGSAGMPLDACKTPPGYVLDSSDCNDAAGSINPGASEVCDNVDNDCSVSTADGSEETWFDNLCDGTDSDLCEEGNYGCTGGVQVCSDSSGDNQDICNGLDDDCDGSTLDGSGEVWFGAACDGTDSDQCEEGNYECAGSVQACSDLTGDDVETCNGVDDDCDGTIDDGLTLETFYADTDGDFFGNAAVATSACSAPSGYVDDDTDCDDDLASVNPGATEVCNGQDENCDTVPDDGLPTSTHYLDSDEDGYGRLAITELLCGPVSGYVANSTDCDDLRITVFPGAPEVCDGRDNDCDGFFDEDPPTLYADTDGDGFGSAGATTLACTAAEYIPFAGDCDDSDPAFNPLADEVCGDALDQDCSGADLACPSYPLMASTIGPLQQGDWWSYAVTGSDTGTLTKTIAIGTETSPESGENCLGLVNGFDLTLYGSFYNLAYLAQDTDGTIRVCGSWESGEISPDWVAAKDGGSYDLYPSPLSVGQFGGSTFSFDTPGAEGAYTYTVDSIESVQTPAGIFSTYKIWTIYSEFWPGATPAEDENYSEYNVSWFAPDYGEVMFDTQFFNFIGTTLDYNVYLSESLTDSNRLSTGCGDVGPGSGQLSQLSGTWVGTGNDHFISGGMNWLDYEVSVTMDGSGNVTEILLNSSDASVTGIATAVDDNLYTIEFSDASTGKIVVDDTFTYMVFIRNTGFAALKDMFFSVLQKGAAGVPATYPKYLPVGSYSGLGYDICPINQEYYRFGATQISVEPEDLLLMPVTGVGPNGFFTGRFGVYSPTHGWWNGYDDDGGDLHMFLSPDGQFAGVYHQVRGGFYVWPSEFAFYALSR